MFKIGILILGGIVGFVLLVYGIEFYLTPRDELKKADVIVAISGGDTEARTRKAIELYLEGYSNKLLFSGAALDPLSPSNAEVMKGLALDAGIDEKDILIEERSQNTAQNAEEADFALNSISHETIILVTSEYHQRRAYLEFQEQLGRDTEIINHSSEDINWPDRWWVTPVGWWLGVSETVKTSYTAARNLF